jgi:CRP-like cAMP-binding protein
MYLHPLTSGLPQFERDDLKKVVDVRSYKRNQYLLVSGQRSQSIFCVATGLLRVALQGQGNHEEVTTDFIRPDEFFMPPSLRHDEFDSPATVIAALPTVVYAIPLRHVRMLCAKYPDLLVGLLEHESRRIGILRTQLRRVTTSSVEKLVSRVLHELTQLAPSENGGYDKRITQALIASYAGISREMVNKTMTDLENRGLVTKDEQGVHVPPSFASTDFGSALPETPAPARKNPPPVDPGFEIDFLKKPRKD